MKKVFQIALLLGVIAAFPPIALAAAPAQSAPVESNLDFLMVGVGLAWVSFIAYVFYVDRKNRDLKHEIDELRQTLGDKN